MNSCESENKSSDEMVFTIDFQDFFDDDEISLQINNCVVFEGLHLKSDPSTGITNVQVILTHKGNLKLLQSSKEKEIDCRLNERSEYVIEVVVNGNQNSFILDLNKGRYLGFDKKENNAVQLNQSHTAFEYD